MWVVYGVCVHMCDICTCVYVWYMVYVYIVYVREVYANMYV